MNDEPREPASAPRTAPAAHARRSRAPGWIWAVPLAALGIVTWLSVRAFSARGVDVTVVFDEAAGMSPKGTKVSYEGLEVGELKSIELARDQRHIVTHLDLDRKMKPLLRAGTRFYLEGAHPNLSDLESLKSILSGPQIVLEPGGGAPQRTFQGLSRKPQTFLAQAMYVVRFTGAVGDIEVGAPVRLHGFTVGEVEDCSLSVDARTGEVSTPVVLKLDPTRFHIRGGRSSTSWKELMDSTLEKLVQGGLRGEIARTPPLLGARTVSLETVPNAAPAQLVFGARYPEIPVVEGAGLEQFSRKLGALPITEIGENVRAITAHVKTLASSPQLTDSIAHLDRSLSELDRTLREAGPQVAPTLASVRETVEELRRTAQEIDATAHSAQQTLGANAAAPGNLQQALRELSGAARAVRTLADYIDQHPESFLRGRTGG